MIITILVSNMVRASFMGGPVFQPSRPRKGPPEGDPDDVFLCVLAAIASPASDHGTRLHFAI